MLTAILTIFLVVIALQLVVRYVILPLGRIALGSPALFLVWVLITCIGICVHLSAFPSVHWLIATVFVSVATGVVVSLGANIVALCDSTDPDKGKYHWQPNEEGNLRWVGHTPMEVRHNKAKRAIGGIVISVVVVTIGVTYLAYEMSVHEIRDREAYYGRKIDPRTVKLTDPRNMGTPPDSSYSDWELSDRIPGSQRFIIESLRRDLPPFEYYDPSNRSVGSALHDMIIDSAGSRASPRSGPPDGYLDVIRHQESIPGPNPLLESFNEALRESQRRRR